MEVDCFTPNFNLKMGSDPFLPQAAPMNFRLYLSRAKHDREVYMKKKPNRLARFCALLMVGFLLLQVLSGCDFLSASEESTDTSETLPSSDASDTSDNEEEDDPSADVPYDTSKYTLSHPELTYTYTEADGKALLSEMESLASVIEKAEMKESEFLTYSAEVEDLLYELLTQYQIAYLETFLYENNETVRESYLYASSLYNTAAQRFIKLYPAIHDSVYAEVYFADWSEEEIADALKTAEMYDEECAALQTRIEELQQEQRTLSDKEYNERSDEIFCELIDLNTALAQKLGYETYMEYAYDSIYERDYTPSETARVTAYANEYLSELLTAAYGNLMAASLTNADVFVLRNILYGSFEDEFCRNLLDEYYAALGGDIYEAYLEFFENGYYFVAYDEELSGEGAFTFYLYTLDMPVIYFGPGYQSVFTFVHEFGHYYNYVLCGDDGDLSFDLAETQSQGDEWLFLAFVCDTLYPNTNISEYLVSYYVTNNLLSLFICLTVNEFECQSYAYALTDESVDYDAIYRTACDTIYSYEQLLSLLGYSPENYWRRVVIENPGYYISYAVSQIPSMLFYALAIEDFSNAAAIYERVEGATGSFIENLEGAGLASPMEEEAYRRIAAVFGSVGV